MKKFKICSFLLLAILVISCSKSDDSQSCNSGFEGASCDIAFNEKFVGIYSSSETCNTGPASYATTITADMLNPKLIVITGLWEEPTASVDAIILDNDSSSFMIERQNFSNGGWDIEASGTINSNGNVNISYKIYNHEDNSLIDECSQEMSPA